MKQTSTDLYHPVENVHEECLDPPRQRGARQQGHQQYLKMALHSHSHLPALHCLLEVYKDSLAVASKHLGLQAEHRGFAEPDSRSQDESVVQLGLLVVHIELGHSQVKAHTLLQQAVEGSCSSTGSNSLVVVEGTQHLELQGFRGSWEGMAAVVADIHLGLVHRTTQDRALPHNLRSY